MAVQRKEQEQEQDRGAIWNTQYEKKELVSRKIRD